VLDRIPAGERGVARLRRELVYRFRQKEIETQSRETHLAADAQKLLKSLKDSNPKDLHAALKDDRLHYVKTDFVSETDKIPQIADAGQIVRMSSPLAKGSLSEPIRGYLSHNYYLAKVLDVQPSTNPPFAQVKK